VIVYCDSSSIVKWFFDEPNMDLARDARDRASLVFTSIVSFPEVLSAMNRALRENRCTATDLELARGEFIRIWPGTHRVRVDEALVQRAGQLVFRHGLRGFDSVQLASALVLRETGEEVEFFFSCFDRNLNLAAAKEGFMVHGEIQNQ
jgi:predicted nucleic acid-binding protein